MRLDNTSKRQYIFAISISLSIHFLFILPNYQIFSNDHSPGSQNELVVELRRSKQKNLIVPESETNEIAKTQTNQLASKNTYTSYESIRRGDESGSLEIDSKNKLQQNPIRKKAVKENKSEPIKSKKLSIPKLKLSAESQLLFRQEVDSHQSDKQRERKLQEAKPFRRLNNLSQGSSKFGSSAHLPSIPDGQVTLLNAKADKHAVFVRRVAHQVFGKLKRTSWNELNYSELLKIRNFSEVRAVMSAQGELIRVKVMKSSGQKNFDRALFKSGEEGVWDNNPPKGALASDGNIHFIFKARTWSRRVGEPQREKRWLLMATGLL